MRNIKVQHQNLFSSWNEFLISGKEKKYAKMYLNWKADPFIYLLFWEYKVFHLTRNDNLQCIKQQIKCGSISNGRNKHQFKSSIIIFFFCKNNSSLSKRIIAGPLVHLGREIKGRTEQLMRYLHSFMIH